MNPLLNTARDLGRFAARIVNGDDALTWRNWSGNERVVPREVARPTHEAEICALLQNANETGRKVKAIGSGHSFTGAAIAPDTQVDLSDYQGLVGIDREKKQVTLKAGTKLWRIPELIAPLGLAMQNLGDINRQSIAGAVSTSTHGTGLSFGGLGSQLAGVRIVTGAGEIVDVDGSDPELLDALRVTIGAYGVVSEITLQLVDDFDLHVVEGLESFDFVTHHWRELCERHDHFEFFWFGHADRVVTKTSRRLAPNDLPRTPSGSVQEFFSDEIVGNAAFAALCQVGKLAPSRVPQLNRIATSGWGESDRVKHWSEGFASPRRVRFYESEYAVPFDAVPEVLREIRKVFLEEDTRITFPIEVRSAAADSAWLATNHGRETGYIAIHQHVGSDYRDYFRRVQAIFAEFEGRPHWGKMHPLTPSELAPLYPRWADALALRESYDPNRVLANPYTAQIFGH